MSAEASSIQTCGPDFPAVRCLLCRRIRPVESTECASIQWDELPGLLHRYRIRLPEIVVSDTYCEECAIFYQQLLTYGHGNSMQGVGWTTQNPPAG